MLKPRLIPVLLLSEGIVVQTRCHTILNPIHNDPAIAVEAFDRWAADEIIVLDITRTPPESATRGRFYAAVERLARKCFVPLTVGGWVTSVEEAARLFDLGADKVTVNTGAFAHPFLVRELAERWGSQAVVLSVDCHRGRWIREGPEEWLVTVDRGRRLTEVRPVEWARALTGVDPVIEIEVTDELIHRECLQPGAGEVLLTAIPHEGVGDGYALDLVEAVSRAVTVPVIAFGGVKTWDHLLEGLKAGASAVAWASHLHYVEMAVQKAKMYLRAQGVDVR